MSHKGHSSSNKFGRNDSCPCGSGKKYKKCCLRLEESKDQPLPALRQVSNSLNEPLFTHLGRLYGPDATKAAWGDFWDGKEEPPIFEARPDQMQWFLPWTLFHWTPGSYSIEKMGLRRLEQPVASDYLEKEGRGLDPASRQFIEESLKEPFSLWEVQRVEPGVGLEVKDLLIEGRRFFVHEVSGSQGQCRWNLMCAKVVTGENESIFDGCLAEALGPSDTEEVTEFLKEILEEGTGKKVGWTLKDLRESEPILMGEYWTYAEEKRKNFRMPRMQTTDGEEMVFTRLYYSFSPSLKEDLKETLGRMEGLSEPTEESDEDQKPYLAFQWTKPGNRVHKDWENTILGFVHLYEDMLVLQTNSRERGGHFRSLVETTCGERIRFQYDSYLELNSEAMEAMLKRRSNRPEEIKTVKDDIPKEIKEKVLGEMLERHYQSWPDYPLPALGGKTPREAVKNEKGKRQVESLIKVMENSDDRRVGDMPPYYFDKLRKGLGLAVQEG